MIIILIIVIIICWGIWGFAEKMALQHGTPWQTLFASLALKTIFSLPIITLIFYFLSGSEGFFIEIPVWTWMFIAVLVNGVAIIFIRLALQRGGAGIIIALTATYPIVTTILAFVFLKENLALTQFLGIGIITLGVIFLNFK